jgi:hypothetical protein
MTIRRKSHPALALLVEHDLAENRCPLSGSCSSLSVLRRKDLLRLLLRHIRHIDRFPMHAQRQSPARIKFSYKLAWLARLAAHAANLCQWRAVAADQLLAIVEVRALSAA